MHDEMEVYKFYEDPANSFSEALTYFPEVEDYDTGPGRLPAARSRPPRPPLTIPVIGSLNGTSRGGWVRYARLIQEAGADALELNIYFVVTDPDMTATELEYRYLELVGDVRESISIPLAVKIGPFFSSLPNMARRLVASGADGLVLFNRFLQPDIDLETLLRHAQPRPQHQRRAPAAAALDRHPPRPAPHLAGGDHRRPHRRGRDQAAPGRGRRDHARLGALQARPGPPPDPARGRPGLARGEGIPVGRADEGERQPGEQPRTPPPSNAPITSRR